MSHCQARVTESNASSPFLGERREELDREEWISAGLLVHQLR